MSFVTSNMVSLSSNAPIFLYTGSHVDAIHLVCCCMFSISSTSSNKDSNRKLIVCILSVFLL